jgi:nitrate/TMAO reductase-like tetraheme cytochrome c subunit
MPSWVVPSAAVFCAVLALLVAFRTPWTRTREGRVLAFLALVVFPLGAAAVGFTQHMERAQSRTFCLSCHIMQDYGKSLYLDDPSYIPARHFQNHLVDPEQACYSCHTTYTMFGTVEAKLKGVRHLAVQYFGTPPKAADIKLYEPYSNRECLHCHLGMRKFEEAAPHQRQPTLLADIKANRKSCTSSGCHDIIHDVGNWEGATFWKEKK